MSHLEKRTRRSLIPIFLTYFLDNFGLAIVYPIFTPLILKSNIALLSSSSPFLERSLTLGLLIGAFPLAQFFGSPLIGQFSDRYGRKLSFYFTIFGTAVGYTFTALAIVLASLPLLFISRFITGLFAGNLTICLAAIADMSPDERSRARNFGYLSAIGGLSFILAILVGGILSDPSFSHHFNPSLPFWLTALLSYANLIVMVLLFQETHPTQAHLHVHPFKGVKNIRLGLVDPSLKILYFVNFLFKLAWVASMQFYPTFLLKNFSYQTEQITYSLIIVGAIWSLANLIINQQLAKRVYPGKSFLYCLLLLALLFLSETIRWPPDLFFFLFYPAVACASLCWTTGLTTISIKAPPEIQGSILGINQSLTAVASVLGPAIGAFLIGFSHHFIFLFCGLCCLLAFRILWKSKLYSGSQAA